MERIVRVTAEFVTTQGDSLKGWIIEGAEDLGYVTNVRITRDGFDNAMIVGTKGRDVFGLPSTITAYQI